MEFTDLKSQQQRIAPGLRRRMDAVLAHGQYIMGPEVAELERELAAFVGVRHCVTVASGTEALLMSLMAAGIGPGDEVITTPFTFAATAEVVVLVGATPVFIDVEPDTCLMDVAQLAAAITPRTKAIIPISLYGQVADMDAITAVVGGRDILVIEDAAQSFGATYKGRRSCATSRIGCTSFFPSKPLGCYGDGGALFTDDDALAQACREIRVHGQSGRYYHTRIGVGGRMDTLQCAIVLAKFESFGWELARRHALGARYGELIRQSGAPVELLTVRPDRDCVWGQYTVMVDDREQVQAALKQAGIPTAVHYPRALHHQPAYAAYGSQDGFPVSVDLAKRVLSLPFSPDMTDADQQRVVEALSVATAGVALAASGAAR